MNFVSIFSHIAVAQGAGAGSPAGGLVGMIPLVLVGVVFYFLLIRPANKQRREHEKLLTELKKGDEVVTNGGFWAKIVSVDERIATLEIADRVKIRILKDRIAGRWNPAETTEKK